MARELHYRWTWTLKASPEQLWPYVADTNRFNRDVGLPAVQPIDSDGSASKRLRFSQFGLRFDWDEEPFEWLRPRRFGVVRRYRRGLMRELRVVVTLEATAQGGTLLTYETWLQPRGLVGELLLRIGMLRNKLSFARAFRKYDALAIAEVPAMPSVEPADFAPGGRARLEALGQRLKQDSANGSAVDRLFEFVSSADELALARVRPHELADAWSLPRRDVLELFLRATKAGMFDLEWDVLCPLCRGAKQTSSRLSDVSDTVHCDTCNIELATNLESAIELTFRLNPAIKPSSRDTFCIGGPQVTPHVVLQQLVHAGETRELQPSLEPGRYRLRALKQPGGRFATVSDAGAATADVRVGALHGAELALAPTTHLTLANDASDERLIILERFAWADTAVTAADVIRLQTFRELFSTELLRPGQEINVTSLTVVFTDLRDSTRTYQQIGDARAFGKVLDHFDVLREEVAAENGAFIKTIGDAVMAAFPRPVNALRAMLNAQRRLAEAPGGTLLPLKAGLHEGPCIAVTLNDRLDYFGSTVNLASRLEKFSTGEDVIVSDIVRNDPEVAQLIDSNELRAEPFLAELKGFDDTKFGLWRVSRAV